MKINQENRNSLQLPSEIDSLLQQMIGNQLSIVSQMFFHHRPTAKIFLLRRRAKPNHSSIIGNIYYTTTPKQPFKSVVITTFPNWNNNLRRPLRPRQQQLRDGTAFQRSPFSVGAVAQRWPIRKDFHYQIVITLLQQQSDGNSSRSSSSSISHSYLTSNRHGI